MWYSFLKKLFAVCELAATGWNPPLPTLTFMTQYSISFIFDVKEHHSQNPDSGKKPTVMSTFSFIAEKKLEFSHLFSPALKNSWLLTSKAIEILQIYLWGYLSDSNSFRRCLKLQLKMFR